MKLKNILYIIFMVVFIAFAYLLFDRGLNAKTKIIVNYVEKGNLTYKVYLKDNDVYDKEYLNMNERYISKLIDNILVEFDYSNLFDNDINGYYSYSVLGNLKVYEMDTKDLLYEKQYDLLNLKAVALDANNVRKIDIKDKAVVDFDKYKEEIENFENVYNIDAFGNLDVVVKIKKNLEFSKINNGNETTREMKIIIPIGYDTFRINVINDNNKKASYYDFSKNERVNSLFILIGIFSLSVGLSFLALTIRNMVLVSKRRFDYNKELTKILDEYGDIIVNVKRFYNKKKYNLIYTGSFNELLDAYKKVGNPISFKETKKGEEAIFLMTEDDNAWIYKMVDKK